MESTLTLVCGECGKNLRTVDMPTGIEIKMSVQVPVCGICRTRAVDAAFLEGQEAMKER